MSELTEGQKLDLLAEIKALLPTAEYAPEKGYSGKSCDFRESCGCYSEYTTDSCSLTVFIKGELPSLTDAQSNLRNAVESRVRRWADAALEWHGCECCGNDLYVSARIYAA